MNLTIHIHDTLITEVIGALAKNALVEEGPGMQVRLAAQPQAVGYVMGWEGCPDVGGESLGG